MKKLKVTKGESKILGLMVTAFTEGMKTGMPSTQKDFASVAKKINALNAIEPVKTKKPKPLSKKEVKSLLKQVVPANKTSREEFLSTLQQNINSTFN